MTWGWDLDHQSYEFSGWMWILRDIQSFHMESERDVFFWREISRCSFRGLIFRDFVLWNCGVVCSRFLQGRTMKSSNLYLSILLIFEEGPLCALKSLQKQQLFLMFFFMFHMSFSCSRPVGLFLLMFFGFHVLQDDPAMQTARCDSFIRKWHMTAGTRILTKCFIWVRNQRHNNRAMDSEWGKTSHEQWRELLVDMYMVGIPCPTPCWNRMFFSLPGFHWYQFLFVNITWQSRLNKAIWLPPIRG